MATQITGAAPTRRSILATRPLMGWRTVDILTIAFLGAALGVAFWGWGVFYNGPVTALKIGYAPLMGLFVGPWFLAGVVGGLVVRRPGAALFCEVVAALVSMLPGTEWGATVLGPASCRVSAPSWRSPSSATRPSARPRRRSPACCRPRSSGRSRS